MLNGTIKEGKVLFLYSSADDLGIIRQYLADNFRWDFNNSKETKELNLTHNLIAGKAGFRTLMNIYDSDQILKFRDRIKNYIKDQRVTADFSEKHSEK